MLVTDEMKEDLANYILDEIREEFSMVHLSGNLSRSLKVYKNGENWVVEIPAIMYDFKTYFSKGVIVPYNGDDSYAQLINKTGGFSKKHKNYVERCINSGIQKWLSSLNKKGRVKM